MINYLNGFKNCLTLYPMTYEKLAQSNCQFIVMLIKGWITILL